MIKLELSENIAMALEHEGFINQESGRKVLTVVHNSDLDTLSNDDYANEWKGSLREALHYTQKDNFEGGYEIVFVSPQDAIRNTDNDAIKDDPLGIGYWTIELTNTLPNIYRGDIVINPGRTMNITLAPLGLRLGSHPVVNNQLQASSSMMVVGDAAHVGYPGSDVTATEEDLALELNRVNFISNQARGSNGADFGAGGGGGAGGAIFLIDGELVINQSVFQSLSAEGGDGSRRADGGDSCLTSDLKINSRSRVAEKGGDGGYFQRLCYGSMKKAS